MAPVQQRREVDVVVVGDGPAGSIAALTLAGSGARVLLLGARHGTHAAARTGQCLPAQGWIWMRTLGLADAFRAGPHLPIVANCAAWARDEIEAMDLIHGAHGHSWLLDRPAFDTLLRDAARARGAWHRQAEGRFRLASGSSARSNDWRCMIR
jgi:flavin-dependent dehydrogenase